MAKVKAKRAAELTGLSKSTIQRAMNTGKLSYELDRNNRRIIDVSELERVFGLKETEVSKVESQAKEDIKRAGDLLEMERIKMQMKVLEEKLEVRDSQLEDMRAQRDQWQKQAQQVLLTSQYSQRQAEEYKAEIKERDRRVEEKRKRLMKERMMSRIKQGANESTPQTSGGTSSTVAPSPESSTKTTERSINEKATPHKVEGGTTSIVQQGVDDASSVLGSLWSRVKKKASA